MLRFLSIRHLAVIDELELEFGPGFIVLTGETGAGKSMVVEALDLLVGGRASAELVRTGEDAAVVQAIVELGSGSESREVLVRREVSAQGRSRAFIDGQLATTAELRALGARSIDLHGQHEHQALLDPASHGPLLDATLGADARARLDCVATAFAAWREAQAALERTQLSEREKAARIEFLQFQAGEIERVAPVAGEDEALAEERGRLANADRLSRLSAEAYAALYESEQAALGTLSAVWKRLAELADLDARARTYLAHRDEVSSRLEDIAFFLRGYGDDLDASPRRLQDVEDRLAALERLKRKHGPSLEDAMAKARALRAELDALGANEARAAELGRLAARTADAFLEDARALSNERRIAAAVLARRLEGALAGLAMPKCRVDVRVDPVESDSGQWSARGIDVVEFYLSPNPGEDVRPLAKIASGGELSRVMLAIHGLGTPVGQAAGRTLVFDEVDAGIGGEAADAVGQRLQELASRCQVLCITHLPQIAARGDVQMLIGKAVRAGRTHTSVTRLNGASRASEIARMIAGAAVTPAVLASAQEMLTKGQASEDTSKGESEGRRPAKAKATRGS